MSIVFDKIREAGRIVLESDLFSNSYVRSLAQRCEPEEVQRTIDELKQSLSEELENASDKVVNVSSSDSSGEGEAIVNLEAYQTPEITLGFTVKNPGFSSTFKFERSRFRRNVLHVCIDQVFGYFNHAGTGEAKMLDLLNSLPINIISSDDEVEMAHKRKIAFANGPNTQEADEFNQLVQAPSFFYGRLSNFVFSNLFANQIEDGSFYIDFDFMKEAYFKQVLSNSLGFTNQFFSRGEALSLYDLEGRNLKSDIAGCNVDEREKIFREAEEKLAEFCLQFADERGFEFGPVQSTFFVHHYTSGLEPKPWNPDDFPDERIRMLDVTNPELSDAFETVYVGRFDKVVNHPPNHRRVNMRIHTQNSPFGFVSINEPDDFDRVVDVIEPRYIQLHS